MYIWMYAYICLALRIYTSFPAKSGVIPKTCQLKLCQLWCTVIFEDIIWTPLENMYILSTQHTQPRTHGYTIYLGSPHTLWLSRKWKNISDSKRLSFFVSFCMFHHLQFLGNIRFSKDAFKVHMIGLFSVLFDLGLVSIYS